MSQQQAMQRQELMQQQAQQQAAMAATQRQQQGSGASAGGDDGVGNDRTLSVAGCNHPTVGSIIRGIFHTTGENHGKPTYQKDEKANGLDVMIYYWDERDGPSFCGWWFGPKVGGDQVWAYHPSRAATPPTKGWKVPYDGPTDSSFLIKGATQASQQSWGQQQSGQKNWGQQQGQQQQEHQQQSQQQGRQQNSQQQSWDQQPKGSQQQDWKQNQQQQGWDRQKQQGGWEEKKQDSWSQQSNSWGGQKQQDGWGQQRQQSGGWSQQDQGQQRQEGWGHQQGQQQGQQQESAAHQQQVQAQYHAQKAVLEQQQAQQQVAAKQKMEEMARKQEELQRQRMAQAEAKRKAEEEKKQQLAAAAKIRMEEQRASTVIRKVASRLKTVQQAGFEELQTELVETLAKEGPNCGSGRDAIEKEAMAALDQAKERLAKIAEQLKKQEEMRIESEKKRQAAQDRCEELLKEFVAIVSVVETSAKAVVVDAEPFVFPKPVDGQAPGKLTDMKAGEVETKFCKLASAHADVKEKLKACIDFAKTNQGEMRDSFLRPPPVPTDDEARLTTARLMKRLDECQRSVDRTFGEATRNKEVLLRKAEARVKMTTIEGVFAKYDKDTDGLLSKAEITKYAKGEFAFDVNTQCMDSIFKVLVADGAKGVRKDNFQKMKMIVGIAREKVKDGERRKSRLEKEARLAKLRDDFKAKLDIISPAIEAVDEKVKKMEELVQPLLSKVATVPSSEMQEMATAADDARDAAKDAIGENRKKVAAMSETVEADVKAWLQVETSKLERRLSGFDARVNKSANTISATRDRVARKIADELRALEAKAIRMIRYHQQTKKLSKEDMFAAVDGDKDGEISEKEFLRFFTACEREPVKKAAKNSGPKKTGEQAAEQNDEEKEADTPEEVVLAEPPSPADLSRVFKHLTGEGEDSLSKEVFLSIIRVFMKVVKDGVITADATVKDSKQLRRIEVGEVIDVLEGPTKDEDVGVMRIRGVCMKDGLTGWVTINGNQGTQFLLEGGSVWKVIKQTTLTPTFELDTSEEVSRALKETNPRTLKVFELVEVKEWPKKDEKSGMMRMKCRAKMDGAVGWATTVSNAGTKFLEMV